MNGLVCDFGAGRALWAAAFLSKPRRPALSRDSMSQASGSSGLGDLLAIIAPRRWSVS